MRPFGAVVPFLLLLIAVAGGVACGRAEGPQSTPRVLKLTTGPEGGGFYPLGRQLAEALNARLGDTELRAVVSAGAVANVEAIQNGTAELALTFADVAYLGFSGRLDRSTGPLMHLRGVTVLQLTPVALAVRPGLSIKSPAELRGRSVGVGPPGSGTALTATLILGAFGLDESTVRIETLGFSDAAQRLLEGRLDAMFDNAINQAASLKEATEGGATLVPIEGAVVEGLRRDYPFLRPTSIRAQSVPAFPRATHTVGVDGLLICRSDLPDDLVYRLTKEFFNVLPTLSLVGEARRMNLDLAPATPIPLHAGAARYYRERELLR